MAGFKFKFNTRALDKIRRDLRRALDRPVDSSTQKAVGQTTVRMMKDFIRKGQSPIQGRGKFPAYKDSYKPTRRRFGRGLLPDLRLSGTFLSRLRYKSDGGQDTVVGYFDSESAAIEAGHRKGTNQQGKRPTIPVNRESFRKRIEKAIEKIYLRRLEKVLSKL